MRATKFSMSWEENPVYDRLEYNAWVGGDRFAYSFQYPHGIPPNCVVLKERVTEEFRKVGVDLPWSFS